MKVNDATREMMRKELEWLPDLLPPDTKTFQVKMIDLDTLSVEPRLILSGNEWVGWGRLFLLDENGKVLVTVGQFSKMKRRFWTKRKIEVTYWSPETVESALKRFPEEAKEVRYILELSWHEGDDAILHKMPRQMKDLPTWLEQKSAEALSSLRCTLGQDSK